MSARITVQSGIAAGTSHRIGGRVARVGSDPQSDVCLPTADIPAHALTLEFRDDGCRVYNRCRNQVQIGSQMVEPNQVAEWPEADVLLLGQDTELLLDFNDHPDELAHVQYLGDEVDEELEPQESSNSAGGNSSSLPLPQQRSSTNTSKTVMQLIVTIFCLVGCVLLILREQNRDSRFDAGPGFSEIVSSAMVNPNVSPELIRRLQHAEAQRVRGRVKISAEQYQAIRDDLVAELTRVEPIGQTGTILESPNAEILRFVQSRILEDSGFGN